MASSWVSPSDMQPGMSGNSIKYPPPSSSVSGRAHRTERIRLRSLAASAISQSYPGRGKRNGKPRTGRSMLVSMTPAAPFAAASLCVAGNLNRDFRIAPVAPGGYLFQDGETSVPFIRETTGGGGANTACAAAALGAKVAFLGKVGADSLGRRLEEALRQQGVDPHLKRDPAAPTGTSINLVYEITR